MLSNLWVAIVISPLLVGPKMESAKSKKSIKGWDFVVQRYQLNLLNRGPASLVNHPRELKFPENLVMLNIQQQKLAGLLAWQCWELSQANLQMKTLCCKRFQPKIKTMWGDRRKLKKAWTDQDGTRSLTQPRHEISPQPSIGPHRPHLEVTLPQSNLPNSQGLPWNLDYIRKFCSTLRLPSS